MTNFPRETENVMRFIQQFTGAHKISAPSFQIPYIGNSPIFDQTKIR